MLKKTSWSRFWILLKTYFYECVTWKKKVLWISFWLHVMSLRCVIHDKAWQVHFITSSHAVFYVLKTFSLWPVTTFCLGLRVLLKRRYSFLLWVSCCKVYEARDSVGFIWPNENILKWNFLLVRFYYFLLPLVLIYFKLGKVMWSEWKYYSSMFLYGTATL